jgi:hypothetical protein
MIAVSNSTPLIALAKINRLDLLKDYFGKIYIPEEVYDEVVRRGGDLAGSSGGAGDEQDGSGGTQLVPG